MSAESHDRPLRILICSANIGNEEPNEESIAAWLPDDGCYSEVVQNTKYPIPKMKVNQSIQECLEVSILDTHGGGITNGSRSAEDESDEEDDQFDIIVIGMQESTFEPKPKPKPPSDRKLNASISPKFVRKPVKKITKTAKNTVSKGVGAVNTLSGDHNFSKGRVENPLLKPITVLDELAVNLGTSELHELIENRCPSYDFAVRYLRGQMRLNVLVRNGLMGEMGKVEVKAENTGIGHVLANKGGIVATFTIRRTRLSFLSAHLAAHEGAEFYKARNSSLAEILDGTRSSSLHDVSITSHHMFICGDMNYRTVLRGADGKVLPKEEHIAKGLAMVEREEWKELNEADELAIALKKGDCLVGFRTLPCFFPPTFKVERERSLVYKDQRTPSYTDRIVWKSSHGLTDKVKAVAYEPVVDFETSDHKPIRGAFTVETNAPSSRSTSIIRRKPEDKKNLHIFVSDMKCTNLKGVKVDGKSNPYIMFVTEPKDLIRHDRSAMRKVFDKVGIGAHRHKGSEGEGTKERTHKGWPRTRVQHRDLNPDWGEDEIRLVIDDPLGDKHATTLISAMLYITVMDYGNPASGTGSVNVDTVLGTVALSISELFDPEECNEDDDDDMKFLDIDEPLVKDGKAHGRLRCKILTWWLNEKTRITFQKRRAITKKLKGTKDGDDCTVS